MKYKKSIALERRVDYYPSPKNQILVKACAVEFEMSKSKVIEDAVKFYFDNMPTEKRQRLLKADNKF